MLQRSTRRCTQQPPALAVAIVTGSSVVRFAADVFLRRLWVSYAFGCMSASRQMSLVSRWHHRVLGGAWALGGVAVIVDLHRAYWWEQRQAWLPALVGIVYTVAGVGFMLGRTWARRVIGVLVVLAALFFADMLLMAGWVGNHPLLHWMLAALGFTAYTAAFILLSAALRSGESS